jgi:anti-sigma factor RsiW
MGSIQKKICPQNLITAYVDGDLEGDDQTLFENHLAGCAHCRSELRAHQLFLCELDSILAGDVDIVVPANFSRVVAARAVSDMSGLRSPAENKKALAFSLILAIAGFALLGSASRELTLNLWRRAAGNVLAVAGLVWTAFYGTVTSITVISRVLSKKFIADSASMGLVLIVLVLVVLLLSRLISNYHRTGAAE